MDKLDNSDTCVDCGKPEPTMHNSREVTKWPGRVEAERYPGYLCTPCWIAANPVLFKHGIRRNEHTSKPVTGTQAIVITVWVLFLCCLLVGIFGRIIYNVIT